MTVDEVIAAIPAWARASRRTVTELHGGITNRNYRVDVDGESFVVRIGGEGTALLGIDRAREYGCTRAAHRMGVAPEAVHFFPDAGVLVTRFISGRILTPEELRQAPTLRRAARSIRRIHDGPEFPGFFSSFRTVEQYRTLAEGHRAPFPANIDELFRRAAEIERVMSRVSVGLRPCHNDLLAANFIDDGETVRVIDWEYAGMGEIFFDLSNFAVNQEFTDREDRLLLETYFGPVTDALVARLLLMKVMSDLREAMWAMVQCGVSTLDFDFPGYGRKHFDRCTVAVRAPGFGALLEQASRDSG